MSGSEETARAERLAAALRENLKRRKAQSRGRRDGAGTPPVASQEADRTDGQADEPRPSGTPAPGKPR